MRILFAGTPDIAVPSLRALALRFTVCGVLSAPDQKKGRGKVLSPPPVKEAALELGLPVLQFQKLGRQAREAAAELKPDLLAVFAYGKIFGPKFLSIFPMGGVNVHPSLLPKYRGCSPISAAILAGDSETGITVQRIALEMDAGDIILQKRLLIHDDDTTESLSKTCSHEGAAMLVDALELIEQGLASYTPQDNSQATYCYAASKDDGLIDWNCSPEHICRMVRAWNPWPKAYTWYRGKKLIIAAADYLEDEEYRNIEPGLVIRELPGRGILVAASHGAVIIKKLQLQSKREMDWKAFLNGNPEFIGSVLDVPSHPT